MPAPLVVRPRRRTTLARWLWFIGILAIAVVGGWATVGLAAIYFIGTPVVASTVIGVVLGHRSRSKALDRSWAWRWFETLTRAAHEDPSGRQVRSLLDTLHVAPESQINEAVQLTNVAFAVQLRNRLTMLGRTADPQEVIADVRRRAIAAVGPTEDDPSFADDADVILLRDIHTPLTELDADQDERLVSFIPLFAAVMCDDPERDLPTLRRLVSKELRRPRGS